MAKSTLDDLQSPDSKILYELLSERIDALENTLQEDMQALAKDLSNVKNDVDTIASVYGFVRNGEGKLYRPV